MSDLREKVAEIFTGRHAKHFLLDADAAIALVLEEAAKVADDLSDRWTKEWRAGLKADSRLEALSDGADDVAFAIRVMKGKA